MGLVSKDDSWRITDELWEKMEPLLPARKAHPLGCHRPRIPDRDAMNAMLLVLDLPLNSCREARNKKEVKELGYRARRWVVERTHCWINRFRRLLVRREKKAGSCLAISSV